MREEYPMCIRKLEFIRWQRAVHIGIACLLMIRMTAGSVAAQVSAITIVIIIGDHARNQIAAKMDHELAVKIQSGSGEQPVSGARVRFILPDSGPSGTFADGSKSLDVTTDQSGMAIARGFHPNDTKGEFQINVEAFYQGQRAGATIMQTNFKKGPGKIIGIVATLVGGGAVAAILIVRPPPSPPTTTITTTITSGTVIVGPPK
jgi:hypothetical protein